MKTLSYAVKWDYNEFRERYFFEKHNMSVAEKSIEVLQLDSDFLKACVETHIFRIQNDLDGFDIDGNSVKRHIVENAHSMSLSWNGPRLVTTPGSDFAHLCGLLMELSSGRKDESFAGAINNYSKSRKRREVEERERLMQREILAYEADEEDNFMEFKEAIEERESQIKKFVELYSKSAEFDSVNYLAGIMILEFKERIAGEKLKYGPNLVWAHRLPLSPDREAQDLKLKSLSEQLRDLEIEVGRARRAAQGPS